MMERLIKLKNILLEDPSITKEFLEILNFFTLSQDDTFSMIFYGVSQEGKELLEKILCTQVNTLLNYDIISRLNFFAIEKVSYKNLVRIDFREKELSDEDKNLILAIFSELSDLNLSVVDASISRGVVPPLIFKGNFSDVAAFLADLGENLEKVASYGLVEKIFVKIKDQKTEDDFYSRVRKIVISVFDENLGVPVINPLDYQFHILNSRDDFAIKAFYESFHEIARKISSFFGIEEETCKEILRNTSFFSLMTSDVLKNSRFFSEYEENTYPTNHIENKFSVESLLMVCTLMLNTSDAHEFFFSSGKLMLEFENNVLYTITKITLDKFRIFYNAFSKFKEISYNNYENLIKILKRLERVKRDLETLVNVESVEEIWSTFKIYISEVLEIIKQIPETPTSKEFSRLEKLLKESEKREKNLSKRSLLGGIISSGAEEKEKAEKEYFFKVLSETKNILENIKKRGLFHDLCNELGKLLPEILEIQPHELTKDISLKLKEFIKELLQPQSSDTVGTKESFSFASENDNKNGITNKND